MSSYVVSNALRPHRQGRHLLPDFAACFLRPELNAWLAAGARLAVLANLLAPLVRMPCHEATGAVLVT